MGAASAVESFTGGSSCCERVQPFARFPAHHALRSEREVLLAGAVLGGKRTRLGAVLAITLHTTLTVDTWNQANTIAGIHVHWMAVDR